MRKYVILHIITHWNKELSLHIKYTNKLIHKILILMSPEKETKFGVTFGQIYLTLSLITTIVFGGGAAWININSRITALETSKTTMEVTFAKERQENREDHKLIVEKLDRNDASLNILIGAVNDNSQDIRNN